MSVASDLGPSAADLLAIVIGYLLGSIPFGPILTRAAGLGDLRQIGSGNIGATNVLRTGHKGLAAATLILDMLKGTAAVLIGAYFGPGAALLAGLAAFLGHIYPVWLGFHGGKGVATYLGILLGLSWPSALVFTAIWLAVAFVTRFSSLAALTATAVVPCLFALQGSWPCAALFLLLTVLLYWRHADNIRRLVGGEETRIGEKNH
jgi:acyl phosphate:glycerol-3-phosphate acyltransferase